MPRNDHFQDLDYTGNLSPGELSRTLNDFIPSPTNTHDLGTDLLRWRNGYFAGDLDVDGNITAEVNPTSMRGLYFAAAYSSGTATAPSTAPTVALESAAGGSIGTTTYYYVITYFNKNGETTQSPVTSFACSSGATNQVKIRPAAADYTWRSGCYGFRVYVGTSSSGPFNLHTPSANAIATTGHYIWGDVILTSLTFSGTQPPSTNTATIDALQVALNATSDYVNNTVSGVVVPSVSSTSLTTPLMLSNQQRILGLASFRKEQSVNRIINSWSADIEVATVIIMGTANAGSVSGVEIVGSGHGILFVGNSSEWYFRDCTVRCTGSGGTYAAVRLRTEGEQHNIIFEEVHLQGDRAAVWASNGLSGNNIFRNARWNLSGANGYLSTGGVTDLDRNANTLGVGAMGVVCENIFTEAGTGIIWDFLNTEGKLINCSNADATPAAATTAVVRYAVDSNGSGAVLRPYLLSCNFGSHANYGAAIAITENSGNSLSNLGIFFCDTNGFTNAIDGNSVINGSQLKIFGCRGIDPSSGASTEKIVNLLQTGAGVTAIGCDDGGGLLTECKIGASLRLQEQFPNNANLKIIRVNGNTLQVLAANGSTVLFALTNAGILTIASEAEIDGALNHDGTTVGFYGTTPVTQAAASADLTGSASGTANGSIQALTDPADTPVTADALRDDLVANLIPELRNNIDELRVKVNNALTALRGVGLIAP